MTVRTDRIVAWALGIVLVAQLMNLWPLPQDAAAQKISVLTGLRADWERSNPANSANPQWAAKARAESLARIDAVLADPTAVHNEARLRWMGWLLAAMLAAAGAMAAWRGHRAWRWLALGLLVLFVWLQKPWHLLGLFYAEGSLSLARGLQQLEILFYRPVSLAVMLLLNVAVPLILLVLAAWGLIGRTKGNRDERPA